MQGGKGSGARAEGQMKHRMAKGAETGKWVELEALMRLRPGRDQAENDLDWDRSLPKDHWNCHH